MGSHAVSIPVMALREAGRRRRLLLINQYFPPDASATAHLLGELAGDLAEYYEVSVVAGRPSYNADAGARPPACVNLLRTRSTTFDRSAMLGRLANYLSFFAGAAFNSMRSPRPDVVVAFTDPPVIGLLGAMVATVRRRPFVYVCWDIFPDIGIALGRLDRPAFVRLWRILNALIRRRADRVVVVGRDMHEKLEREGVPGRKIAMIPHWANPALPSTEERQEARRRHGWGTSFVVMHGGNMGLAQNLGFVIAAAERLRNVSKIRFVFVGDGATRRQLESEATARGLANVEFMDYRPKEQALTTLAAADLHLVSLAPGLKGSVVASKTYGILALARPFVAAVEAGSEIALLAEETQAGVRVEPSDPDGMAERIREFAEGNRDGEYAGARGRRAFEARFRREHGIQAYRELLEGLLVRF